MTEMLQIRNKLGLSQAELAERLGLHQSTISRFERGELEADKRTILAVRALAALPEKPRRAVGKSRA